MRVTGNSLPRNRSIRDAIHWLTYWLTNVRALPEARFGWGVNGGKEFRARPVKPFGRGRPWVRWMRALCKFN